MPTTNVSPDKLLQIIFEYEFHAQYYKIISLLMENQNLDGNYFYIDLSHF